MFDKLEILKMAGAMAEHAAARQNALARNIANADTPGYRAQDLADFAESYSAAEGSLRATRPGHFGAGAAGLAARPVATADTRAPNGNTVSLEAEMVRAADVRQQHDLALSVYRSTLGILRTSLGRRG